jgi:hypothetical protein
MVKMSTKHRAELARSRRDADATGESGVDRLDRRIQIAVLGDHEVDLVEVLLVGQVASQHRPQIVVLGAMVYLEDRTECRPALRRGGWPFQLRGEGFEAGCVTPQPGVDGAHEAQVGWAAVVASLPASPGAPDGEHQAGGDGQ